MAIFSLSVFALFTTIYKTAAELPKLKEEHADFSWIVSQVILWGMIESNVVIIAGSIPTWGWVIQSEGFKKLVTWVSLLSLWTSDRSERLESCGEEADKESDKVGLRLGKGSPFGGHAGSVELESIKRIERVAYS